MGPEILNDGFTMPHDSSFKHSCNPQWIHVNPHFSGVISSLLQFRKGTAPSGEQQQGIRKLRSTKQYTDFNAAMPNLPKFLGFGMLNFESFFHCLIWLLCSLRPLVQYRPWVDMFDSYCIVEPYCELWMWSERWTEAFCIWIPLPFEPLMCFEHVFFLKVQYSYPPVQEIRTDMNG